MIFGLVSVAILAWLAEYIHNLVIIGGQAPISGVIIAIGLGMALRNVVGIPEFMKTGADFSLKKLLRLAIILLGLGLSFAATVHAGGAALLIIVICISAATLTMGYVGRLLKLQERLAALIGIGTAICGATAIVATAPAIEADDEDIALAVATITLFGVLAIFLYPILGRVMGLTDVQFGTWSGVAVHETAQVVAAGFSFSEAAGKVATVVKLTRTTLLAPMVLVMSILYAHRGKSRERCAGGGGSKESGAGRESMASGQSKEAGGRINYARIFPWFALGFVAMSVVRTIGDAYFGGISAGSQQVWGSFLNGAGDLAKFFILMAMAGVGLLTNLSEIRRIGIRPLFGGLIASVIMAGFSLLLVRMMVG